MAKTIISFCSLPILMAGLLSGAVNLTGPVAGYVAGPAQPELRAITGVPGSYLFSEPLSLPPGTTRVHLAPGREFGLIERGAAGLAVLYLAGGEVDRVEALDGALPAADWAAFSPGAASAILFSSSLQRLQLLTGFPTAPRLARELDATVLPEPPRMAGVSDDGNLLVVASGHSVYLVPTTGPAQLLLSVGEILSVAVLPNGTDVVLAERSTDSIHLLHNAASSEPAIRVLASGLPGIGVIYPAADGAAIFVARPGAQAVSSVDVVSGLVRTFPAGVAPVQLTPLLNRDTFLITGRPRQPTGVFLCDRNEGRTVFIPAAQAERAQ
jgi:hypothetical protein